MKLKSLVFAAAAVVPAGLAPAAALAQPMAAQPRAVGYAPANPQPTTARATRNATTIRRIVPLAKPA